MPSWYRRYCRCQIRCLENILILNIWWLVKQQQFKNMNIGGCWMIFRGVCTIFVRRTISAYNSPSQNVNDFLFGWKSQSSLTLALICLWKSFWFTFDRISANWNLTSLNPGTSYLTVGLSRKASFVMEKFAPSMLLGWSNGSKIFPPTSLPPQSNLLPVSQLYPPWSRVTVGGHIHRLGSEPRGAIGIPQQMCCRSKYPNPDWPCMTAIHFCARVISVCKMINSSVTFPGISRRQRGEGRKIQVYIFDEVVHIIAFEQMWHTSRILAWVKSHPWQIPVGN